MQNLIFATDGRYVEPECFALPAIDFPIPEENEMDKQARNDAMAKRYASTRDSVAAIAKDAGIGEAAARNILSAKGARRRPIQADRNTRIALEMDSGRAAADVAKEFGVSPGWARRLAKSAKGGDGACASEQNHQGGVERDPVDPFDDTDFIHGSASLFRNALSVTENRSFVTAEDLKAWLDAQWRRP